MVSTIDILLSTYNGEKYLRDQIDSIINQTFSNWRLIIRDDGSSDNTLEIIHQYKQYLPEKIILLNDSPGSLGPARSFSCLMQESSAPYIAFCDQDDVWLVDKLEKQLALLQQYEKQRSDHYPLLVHSDLIVVDQHLSVISRSFWQYQHLSPAKMSSFQSLLVQNYVTGCSCLFNRALLERSVPVSADAIMHDWWLALIAMDQGKIINMPEPTLMYRQHDKNDTGAKRWSISYFMMMLFQGRDLPRQALVRTGGQAKALLKVAGMSEENMAWAEKYSCLFKKNWLQRRLAFMSYGFRKYGFLRNLAVMLYL